MMVWVPGTLRPYNRVIIVELMDISFTSAASFSLEALADLFTRSFEGYYYPGTTTPELLARRVRVEDVDLLASPVLLVDGEPAGLALIARRGRRAWCGGFGVTAAWRGRGLAHALTSEMLARARAAGAANLTLEVLTRNERAFRAYLRAGLRITRRLLVLSWRPGDEGQPEAPPLDEADPAGLVLAHFNTMHPAPPAWQREPAALLAESDTTGLVLHEGDTLMAYAIVRGGPESTRILDLGAREIGAATRLIAGLQSRAAGLISVNEPATSPISAALQRTGFMTADEQHEMRVDL